MTSEVVSVLLEGGGGWRVCVGMLHTGDRCEATVLFLFLAVSFLSFCVEGGFQVLL
jgi:hypothetical protein